MSQGYIIMEHRVLKSMPFFWKPLRLVCQPRIQDGAHEPIDSQPETINRWLPFSNILFNPPDGSERKREQDSRNSEKST